MKTLNCLLIAVLIIFILTCGKNSKSGRITSQSDYPSPPAAAIIPDTMMEFGNMRIDNYFWLKDRSNPSVMTYLKDIAFRYAFLMDRMGVDQ